MFISSKKLVLLAITFSWFLSVCEQANAQVRLESICKVEGNEEVRLVGMGLVVGLNGTGDGGGAGPTINALAAAMKAMRSPIDSKELGNAKNVAIVMVHATIPRTGLHKGQRLDCFVSSHLNAKSLQGGRLFVTPLQSDDLNNELVIGIAEGAVVLEDALTPTSGRIPRGVLIKDSYFNNKEYLQRIVDTSEKDSVIRLLLDGPHSSYISARAIAERINEEYEFESYGEQHAKAESPSRIAVRIPEILQDSPIDFIAELMDLKINSPHSISRVLVNSKTGVVIISGDVELSPVLINHPNLQVNIVGGNTIINGATFKSLVDGQTTRTTSRLDELVKALNELGVPREAMIEVLRELHNSGKLHADYKEL